MVRWWSLSWLAVVCVSCAPVAVPKPAPPAAHLIGLDAAACRALLHDGAPVESLQQALLRSSDYLQRQPPDRVLTALDHHVTTGDLLALINTIVDALTAGTDVAQFVCEHAVVYRADLPRPLLVTGYYEPELVASRTRSERFRYPLYRTPDDLIDVDISQFCPECPPRITHGRVQDGKLVPYYSRAEIEAGALDGRDHEIAWLDDPVEVFFLHVQGSARLRFEDGVYMDVSYSSSNGHPYTSLGRVLIEQGKMAPDAVSLSSLKEYLRSHPDEQAALMALNQRYIFFRAVAAGPVGSLGVPLTAGRTLAADHNAYPPGALTFLRIGPRTTASEPAPAARFAVIQDAGAAINGPQHLDVFWGSGPTAEAIAGDMRNPGELYLMLPR